MMNAYSPSNFQPDGTLGALGSTWSDVWDKITDAAKDKATDLGTQIVTQVKLPGTGGAQPTGGAPAASAPVGQVTIIERAGGFGQWIADNPIPAAGIAGLALYLLIRRR